MSQKVNWDSMLMFHGRIFFLISSDPSNQVFPKKCPRKTANFALTGHFLGNFDFRSCFGKADGSWPGRHYNDGRNSRCESWKLQ